jgi:hypothetical protein
MVRQLFLDDCMRLPLSRTVVFKLTLRAVLILLAGAFTIALASVCIAGRTISFSDLLALAKKYSYASRPWNPCMATSGNECFRYRQELHPGEVFVLKHAVTAAH